MSNFQAHRKQIFARSFWFIFGRVALSFFFPCYFFAIFFVSPALLPGRRATHSSSARALASPLTVGLFTVIQPTARRYRHHDRAYRVFQLVLTPATRLVRDAAPTPCPALIPTLILAPLARRLRVLRMARKSVRLHPGLALRSDSRPRPTKRNAPPGIAPRSLGWQL